MTIYALLTKHGTACDETVLHESEYTPEARARIEAEARKDTSSDAPMLGTWTDVTDNDALSESKTYRVTLAVDIDVEGDEDPAHRASNLSVVNEWGDRLEADVVDVENEDFDSVV